MGTRNVARAGGNITLAEAWSRIVAGLFLDLVFEQGADCPASPREPAHDRTDRYAERVGRFVVTRSFDTDQQDDRTLPSPFMPRSTSAST